MPDFNLDASVAASWCFQDEAADYTEAILNAVTGLTPAAALRLWAYEVRNSVLISLRRQRIAQLDAEVFFTSLLDLNITLVDPVSYDDVFSLAHRYNLTFYDAAYLDLAIRAALPIATLDKKLVQAAVQSGINIFKP